MFPLAAGTSENSIRSWKWSQHVGTEDRARAAATLQN